MSMILIVNCFLIIYIKCLRVKLISTSKLTQKRKKLIETLHQCRDFLITMNGPQLHCQ
jgi:hypothetical protein